MNPFIRVMFADITANVELPVFTRALENLLSSMITNDIIDIS